MKIQYIKPEVMIHGVLIEFKFLQASPQGGNLPFEEGEDDIFGN